MGISDGPRMGQCEGNDTAVKTKISPIDEDVNSEDSLPAKF